MATLCIEGFGGFVASTAAPIATGWSDKSCRAGIAPAEDPRLFTAHAKTHAKAPHLRPMEMSSQDFDFRDGFLRRVLVRQRPFNEARNSVSSNGRLMGRLQQTTAKGVAESPRTRA